MSHKTNDAGKTAPCAKGCRRCTIFFCICTATVALLAPESKYRSVDREIEVAINPLEIGLKYDVTG